MAGAEPAATGGAGAAGGGGGVRGPADGPLGTVGSLVGLGGSGTRWPCRPGWARGPGWPGSRWCWRWPWAGCRCWGGAGRRGGGGAAGGRRGRAAAGRGAGPARPARAGRAGGDPAPRGGLIRDSQKFVAPWPWSRRSASGWGWSGCCPPCRRAGADGRRRAGRGAGAAAPRPGLGRPAGWPRSTTRRRSPRPGRRWPPTRSRARCWSCPGTSTSRSPGTATGWCSTRPRAGSPRRAVGNDDLELVGLTVPGEDPYGAASGRWSGAPRPRPGPARRRGPLRAGAQDGRPAAWSGAPGRPRPGPRPPELALYRVPGRPAEVRSPPRRSRPWSRPTWPPWPWSRAAAARPFLRPRRLVSSARDRQGGPE